MVGKSHLEGGYERTGYGLSQVKMRLEGGSDENQMSWLGIKEARSSHIWTNIYQIEFFDWLIYNQDTIQ